MEQIPHSEQTISLENFEQIVSIKWNGESTTMSKCINCNIVMMNATFNMWKHWKYTCPYKMLFKYNPPTSQLESGIEMTITCLVCRNTFNETTISFMTLHRMQCKERPQVEYRQLANDYRSSPSLTIPPTQRNDTSERIQSRAPANQPASATYRIEPSNGTSMRFTIKKTNTKDANKSRRNGKETHFHFKGCHICQVQFLTKSNNPLERCDRCKERHSNTTNSDQNTLISVQTVHSTADLTASHRQIETGLNGSVHHESDAESSAVRRQSASQVCFICNTTNSPSFTDLYGTMAAHSGKRIFDFIWKFLDGKPSVRNETMDASSLCQDVVCTECLSMINGYDNSRVVAKRYKKLLQNRLAITENFYQSLQDEIDGRSSTVSENRSDNTQTNSMARTEENEVIDLDTEDGS